MPRGGKRPGAGAKRTRPPAKRRLMLELGATEARQLARLEQRLGIPASAVLRSALDLYYRLGMQEHGPMKTLVAIALLALAACSPAPADRAPLPYDVYAKPGQPQHVRDDARAAVESWNAGLRERFGFDVLVWHEEGVPDPEACGTVVIGYGGRRGTHNGQASADRADPCHLSINLSEAGYWNTTLAHEFGHVLGLEDEAFDESAEGVQSIMMQSTLNKEILPSDVDAVCTLWGVD